MKVREGRYHQGFDVSILAVTKLAAIRALNMKPNMPKAIIFMQNLYFFDFFIRRRCRPPKKIRTDEIRIIIQFIITKEFTFIFYYWMGIIKIRGM